MISKSATFRLSYIYGLTTLHIFTPDNLAAVDVVNLLPIITYQHEDQQLWSVKYAKIWAVKTLRGLPHTT